MSDADGAIPLSKSLCESVIGGAYGDSSSIPGTKEFEVISRTLDCRPFTYRLIKRSFDVLFSALVLTVGLIPGGILAAAIAVDTKGSPIYSQERVGRYGKPFRIYKFRSMVADADNVEQYFTPEQLEVWKRERKVSGDPRITKLGAFLRKTSLDELPQFLNVLVGNISVVGPRSITFDELENFGADAALLCSVPGGITGLWQTSRRNEATFASGERQRIELGYVRNCGVAMDVRCFFKTFAIMFGKKKTGR